MQSLAEFVAAGNQLVIVRGNHDVDWHWDCVQAEFTKRLARSPSVPEGPSSSRRGSTTKKACSTSSTATNTTRTAATSTCSIRSHRAIRGAWRSRSPTFLVRYIVRPTRGIMEGGHEKKGMLDYLRFGTSLGARGGAPPP